MSVILTSNSSLKFRGLDVHRLHEAKEASAARKSGKPQTALSADGPQLRGRLNPGDRKV